MDIDKLLYELHFINNKNDLNKTLNKYNIDLNYKIVQNLNNDFQLSLSLNEILYDINYSLFKKIQNFNNINFNYFNLFRISVARVDQEYLVRFLDLLKYQEKYSNIDYKEIFKQYINLDTISILCNQRLVEYCYSNNNIDLFKMYFKPYLIYHYSFEYNLFKYRDMLEHIKNCCNDFDSLITLLEHLSNNSDNNFSYFEDYFLDLILKIDSYIDKNEYDYMAFYKIYKEAINNNIDISAISILVIDFPEEIEFNKNIINRAIDYYKSINNDKIKFIIDKKLYRNNFFKKNLKTYLDHRNISIDNIN